ncbi:MAG: HNH endonuclease [Clostridiaceae bacterium]|jgi:5-methylcytosine-specific restriction protein A|nr:HNH endonuclease [Clostridiaceae bacterium]
MPYKPKKPCAYHGCPELTHERFCDKHRQQAAREYNRYTRDGDSKKFYNSEAWRRLAKRQLRLAPLCAECMRAGRVQPAEIADHIKPIREGGARLDGENLQSLCMACHNCKHG